MKDGKLNNLLGIEEFSTDKVFKKAKTTKRTEVAKDILQENAYVVGKDVLNDKMKGKEVIKTKELNNLICLDDFTKETPKTSAKSTKRTEVAKDVLQEKMKAKAKEKEECCDDDDDDKKSKGLTAAQKKLPKALQDSILKRKKK